MTYWRIDHIGYPLSRSFRSANINDSEELEEATSAYHSMIELLEKGGYVRGTVAVVEFRGQCVATGLDNEPVVVPEEELRRWTHDDWRGLPRDIEADEVEDLVVLGFAAVETMAVED